MKDMIRENQSSYKVVAKSHPGSTGKNNEDRFGVSAFRFAQNEHESALLAVLCDGIGGHQAGEVAAELAVDTISNTIANSSGDHPLAALEQGIHLANQAIYEAANHDHEKKGMGSTCACVFLRNNRLYTATIGDSRIYLMQGDRIRQISTDHTWIEEALEAGIITPDQVKNHPNRHVIRRYLGAPHPPVVDFRLRLHQGETDEKSLKNQGVELQAGDRLLLCSDGLTDLVSDAEILAAFDNRTEEKAVEGLIDLANQRGGHDNITIISAVVPHDAAEEKMKPKKKSFLPYGCVIAAIMIGLITTITLGYFWWKGFPWETTAGNPTPPIQATLNPFITSPPQPSATLGPTQTPLPSPTPTETEPASGLLTTETPQRVDSAYPAPDVDAAPTSSYP